MHVKILTVLLLVTLIVFISGCLQKQPQTQHVQICGNNIKEGTEQCDGTALSTCQYGCTTKCTCAPQTNCSDGTLYGQCSSTKPILCDNGTLIDDCLKCGCFPGYNCQADGSCYIISFFDGDPIAQSIINGGTYQLSENNYFTNGKVNTLSFEFKL
jgi:hypothetical protein